MHIPSRPAATPMALVASVSTWHCCLDHPGVNLQSKLCNNSSVPCSRSTHDFCHTCHLGHHTCMPFDNSSSRVENNFDLIHCDLWTSLIVSISSYKYYLIILDDCSYFMWTFLLQLKTNIFITLLQFFAYASTQFGRTIKVVQCDNGREFNNATSRMFFASNGVVLWMSCPYTSPHNGKAERALRSINNMIWSLIFLSSILAHY
jgi:hypothetical protein